MNAKEVKNYILQNHITKFNNDKIFSYIAQNCYGNEGKMQSTIIREYINKIEPTILNSPLELMKDYMRLFIFPYGGNLFHLNQFPENVAVVSHTKDLDKVTRLSLMISDRVSIVEKGEKRNLFFPCVMSTLCKRIILFGVMIYSR